MFQHIRYISRALLVSAALAAVALTSHSAPSATAANGKWSAHYATTTRGVIGYSGGGSYHATTGVLHYAGNGKWC